MVNPMRRNEGEDTRRVTFVLPPAIEPSEQVRHMGHCSGVNSICILNDTSHGKRSDEFHSRLFTASRDSLVKSWDVIPCKGNRNSRVHLAGEYEGHVDWVNDIALVNNRLISSCSSDGTIRLWKSFLHEDHVGHVEQGSLACFSGHSDYVTKLCCPGRKHSTGSVDENNTRMFSCGLLGEVYEWDVERSAKSQRPMASLSGKDHSLGSSSVYSIACDFSGHLVCIGCSSGKIYVIDTRSGLTEFELLGHTDNVRGLVLGLQGTSLVSGGSDHMIKIWDLKQRRCVHTCAIHTDSVWCLDTMDDDVTQVYSAGKDGCVYKTDTVAMTSRLIVRERHPITALGVGNSVFGPRSENNKDIWIGSEDSSIHCFIEKHSAGSPISVTGSVASVRSRRIFESTGDFHPLAECSHSQIEIAGTPSIIEVSMLTDKIHLISRDSGGKVGIWDVTKATKTKDFGVTDFKDVVTEHFDPTQSALTWFQPDCSLGVVAGHLQPSNCFTCETYTKQLGYSEAPPDQKVNLAVQMLHALFNNWKLSVLEEEKEDDTTFEFDKDVCGDSSSVFKFAKESSPAVMVSGDQYSLPWKKSCHEMDGSEDVPEWVSKCILEGEYPTSKALKMCFVLVPKRGTNLPPMGQSRLTAPRVLQVEKMLDYVIKRLNSKGIECYKKPIYWKRSNDIHGDKPERNEQQVILTCNDMLIPSDFTLAAVRQWMWKKPDDLRIEYTLADSKASLTLPKIKMPM